MRYARRQRCEDGRLRGWNHGERRWPHLWFHRCNTCDVVTLPFVTRWLDPSWTRYVIHNWWRFTAWNWWMDVKERWRER